VRASQAVFIDNTPMFVQIAEGLRIQSILHTDCKSMCTMLSPLGLVPRPCDLVIAPEQVRTWTPARQPVWRPVLHSRHYIIKRSRN
jgi:hypothetical protein